MGRKVFQKTDMNRDREEEHPFTRTKATLPPRSGRGGNSTVGHWIPQNYTPSQSISEGPCLENASQNSLDHSRPTAAMQTH